MEMKIRTTIIDEQLSTESDYQFKIKANFPTLGFIIQITPQGPILSFVFGDSIRNLLAIHETVLYKEYNLSPNLVDILSFDKIFLNCDNTEGTI